MSVKINGVTVAGNGAPGKDGANGKNATINGVNALTLKATGGLTGQQSGDVYNIDGSGLVPKTTTVNGKPLSGNVSLAAGDVGADSAGSAASALTDAKAYADGLTAADVGALPISGGTLTGQLNCGGRLLRGIANPTTGQDAVNLQYAQANFAPNTHNHGVIPISQGGTGVSSMTGTDYTTNRPRGIILQASEPSTVANGCLVGVYE